MRWLILILLPFLLAGCHFSRSKPLPYSSPAGTVDQQPRNIFAFVNRILPEPEIVRTNGKTEIVNVEKTIQSELIKFTGESHPEFLTYSVTYAMLSHSSVHYFYKNPTAGPFPGICEVDAFAATEDSDWFKKQTPLTLEPSGKRYTIVGSISPIEEGMTEAYKLKLTKACQARRDTWSWFMVDDLGDFITTIRLLDQAVSAARRNEELPFDIECAPFPPFPFPEYMAPLKQPQCEGQPRSALAKMNLRAIPPDLQSQFANPDCAVTKACTSLGLAKDPSGIGALYEEPSWEEDLWLIRFELAPKKEGKGKHRINKIIIEDIEVNMEGFISTF